MLTNAEEGRYDKGSEPPNKPPSDLHDPYFILVSYALEDLFKAIIIRDRNDEVRRQFIQTRSLPKFIKTHELTRLAREANIKIDIKEEHVLKRLSRWVKWKSRYPVPVELSDMRSFLRHSNGKEYFVDYFKPDVLDELSTMVNRVKAHLKLRSKGD